MRHRGAFTPREDQGVDPLQVTGEADGHTLDLAGAECGEVFTKVAL
jgi:hypothetical protein